MRISALHQDWLYEDKDVERIPASIERGVFEDIPRICDEVIGNLRALNERLTEIEESPTYESLRTEFQERGRQYREMLNMAGIALSRALTALASPGTRERFERWRSFRGIEDLEIEDALSHAAPASAIRKLGLWSTHRLHVPKPGRGCTPPMPTRASSACDG